MNDHDHDQDPTLQDPPAQDPPAQDRGPEPDDVEHTLPIAADRSSEAPAPTGFEAPEDRTASGPEASPAAAQPTYSPAPPQGPGAPEGQYASPSRAAQSGPPHSGPGQQPTQPSYSPTQQLPAYGAPGPYGGYGAVGSGPAHRDGGGNGGRTRVSGWLWPSVCALALVVGLVGGALGGLAFQKWDESNDEPGRAPGGLAEVDTVSQAPLPAENGSVAAVAEKMLPSTVQIIADLNGEQGGATGSGFYLDKQGHVVTNNHVIEDAAEKDGKIQVVDHKGRRHDATVVGRSGVYDLAVLYVEDAPDVTPAALGSSKSLRVGESVVAIGSPLGLSSTVTAGIVSALDRPVTTGRDSEEDLGSYINAVQTDAAINPGNSGGPLLDLAGQVVGVTSAIAQLPTSAFGGPAGSIGLGFAIPAEQAERTATQLIETGRSEHPVMGVHIDLQHTGEGAQVMTEARLGSRPVLPGGPAEEAGVRPGDLILQVDDTTIRDSQHLLVVLRSYAVGDTVTMRLRSTEGEERTVTLTLAGSGE